jgi:hypothetical protein
MNNFTKHERPLRQTATAVAVVAMIAAVIGTGAVYNIFDLSGPTGAYSPGTFTDKRDGKKYKTVVIGGRRWLAENLNYRADSSWCYGNNSSNCDKYGRLYVFQTAKKVCPAGWHLPKQEEWVKLGLSATAVERWPPECWYCRFGALCDKNDTDSIRVAKPECMDCPCFGERLIESGIEDWYDAGYVLKAESGWNGEHGNGADDFGFSALPGGYRDRYYGGFYNAGDNGYWWSAASWFSWRAYIMGYDIGSDRACYRNMSSGSSDMREDGGNKSNAYSVRCVQNGFAPR